jgi:hypothetical protein
VRHNVGHLLLGRHDVLEGLRGSVGGWMFFNLGAF